MSRETNLIVQRAAAAAEAVILEELGFSLSDDESCDLQNAMYHIINAAKVAEAATGDA